MAKTLGKLAAPALAAALIVSVTPVRAEMVRFTTVKAAPPPARMAAVIEIAKGTSTSMPRAIDVARITGTDAPRTYSGDLAGPYPGFSWFVSRHYAILSDMDDGSVRDALVLLELAWPHYVRTFQWRPPASDTHRQAIVFASSRSVLEDCLLHDSIHAPLLGGLTMEGFGCAYLYAGAPYQTRYIILHEATHLYQYCLSGDTRGCYGFLLEGIADFLSSHIYDPGSRTLNVNVLDRAPIHNHLLNGLDDWRKLGQPTFSALFDNPSPSRGLSVLMTAFLQHTPGYEAKWRLFCERIVRDMSQKDAKRTTLAAFRAIYGKPESLDAPFKAWMSNLRPTFELHDRDFDQSAPGVFTALPPSNATARLAIRMSTALGCGRAVDASLPACRIYRSAFPNASAGFTLCGLNFAMSNTWSGGCVFSVSLGKKHQFSEVPVAFMRGYNPPFSILVTVTNDTHFVAVSDTDGTIVAPSFRLASSASGQSGDTNCMTLFASGAPTRFEIPALQKTAPVTTPGGDAPRPFPEISFPDFDDTITDWEVLGPLSASEATKNNAPPPDDANLWADDGTRLRWRQVSAHPEMPITPPLINLNEVFRRQGNDLVAYARAEIDADTDTTTTLLLGVADGAEVFVNGNKAAACSGKREWSDGNLRIDGVRLRKGRNRLAIRLVHADSAWLLSGRIERPDSSR